MDYEFDNKHIKDMKAESEKKIKESYGFEELREKKTKVESWFMKNKGMDTEEFRENITHIAYDNVALCKVFSTVLVVADHLTCSVTIPTLKEKLMKHINHFGNLIYDIEYHLDQCQKTAYNKDIKMNELRKFVRPWKKDMISFSLFILEGTKPMSKRVKIDEAYEDIEDEDFD